MENNKIPLKQMEKDNTMEAKRKQKELKAYSRQYSDKNISELAAISFAKIAQSKCCNDETSSILRNKKYLWINHFIRADISIKRQFFEFNES